MLVVAEDAVSPSLAKYGPGLIREKSSTQIQESIVVATVEVVDNVIMSTLVPVAGERGRRYTQVRRWLHYAWRWKGQQGKEVEAMAVFR